MRKKIILLVGIVLIIVGVLIYPNRSQREHKKMGEVILYSWKLDKVLKDKEAFDSVLREYQIDTLYQDFSSEYFKESDDSFIRSMKEKGIRVYHLAGDPSWGREKGFLKIQQEIDKVNRFNERSSAKISGLLLDIEPYVSEREEKFAVSDFKVYVQQIEKSYAYIKDKNLELRLAIPYWFDSIDLDLLEKLIEHTDGISVMNYNIQKTAKNIQNEVLLAKKHHKKIDTIYEVEYGKKGYFSSLGEILEDFQAVKRENYIETLGIAYHHYGSF